MTDVFPTGLASALADRYRIERILGSGGMATVYVAHDVRHDRKVAVKVLRPELAAVLGADRFVREIRTTANLQHPHIMPLFDSGSVGRFLYYVMPFVDGETLRAKLDRELQLGIADAVRLTTQVADALDYAHRHHVIHRDIKPENILLHDGRPMVVDFGIALAITAAAGRRITESGMSLGTPHYMSPEQAAADRDVTQQSDIYALGSVLYEMLTGEPPHTGSSAQQIMTKIVTEPARSVVSIRRSVPPNVAAALAKSLEKVPADRFVTASEFARALDNPLFAQRSLSAGTRRQSVRRALVGGLLLAASVLAVWGWLPGRSDPPASSVRRLNVLLADSAPLAIGTGRPALALSRDGTKLAFVARVEGETQINVRDMVTGVTIAVPGSERSTGPFVSTTGRLGFFRVAQLMAGDVNGGPASAMVGTTPVTRGASWINDSTVVVVSSPNSGVALVPLGDSDATSGDRRVWITPQDSGRAWPTVVQDGAVLYTIATGSDPDGWKIGVVSRDGSTRRILVEGGSNPVYASSGHIVFVRNQALWAIGFDVERLMTWGDAVMMVEGVLTEAVGVAHFAVSNEGTLIYAPGAGWRASRRVVWVNRDGRLDALPFPTGLYTDLALSPGGQDVALTRAEGSNYDVWVGDVTRGAVARRTRDPGEDGSPVWAPNSRSLAIATEQGGSSPHLALLDLRTDSLWVIGEPSPNGRWPLSAPTGWSANGNQVFVTFKSSGWGWNVGDIYAFDVDGRTLLPWLQGGHDLRSAIPSPNGSWVAYVSDETGSDEVYVRDMQKRGTGLLASVGGGAEPRWGPTSGSLYYRRGNRILAVTIGPGTGGQPVLSTPQIAFRLPSTLYLAGDYNSASWDISHDEQRILALQEVQSVEMTSLNVIVNWFDELTARVR